MGDSNTRPLPENIIGVIDYAHHPLRSALRDILLCARCKFFLGNTSGLFLVSSVFGVPSALTNQIPFPATGFRRGDLSIPKLIRQIGQANFLTAREILTSPVANFRMTRLYQNYQLEPVENTADEICELAIEMLEIINGSTKVSLEAELCWEAFAKLLQSEHYCYGTTGRISQTFLVRHKSIFC